MMMISKSGKQKRIRWYSDVIKTQSYSVDELGHKTNALGLLTPSVFHGHSAPYELKLESGLTLTSLLNTCCGSLLQKHILSSHHVINCGFERWERYWPWP